jgi:hypothetical protein
MDFILGTNKSLALANLCNGGLTYQLHNKLKNDSVCIETALLSIIIGVYMADLHSGLVHYLLDNYEGDYPPLKKGHLSFMNHHNVPSYIINSPKILLFKETVILPYNVCCLLYNTTQFTSASQIITQLAFLLSSNLCQATHRIAHYVNNATKKDKKQMKYKISKLLQDSHIVLKTEEHRKHHQTYDTNYSILNGWSNPLLNHFLQHYDKTAKKIINKI